MARYRKGDLEFAVDDASGKQRIYPTFAKAAVAAVSLCCSGSSVAVVDVLCHSRAAAIKWQGDEGGEEYDEDPDASVFERIEIRAASLGRVR